ncbi:hypothetical protein B484DRAFT_483811 [Ochromonadaceae sp. CCMP2298]|nr:hypothetical protein B484DRAFT_483811 [Ochromonadaceae sp. CCMP2298]
MEGEGDAGEVVFETSAPVLFSPLEKKLGISLQWKPWKIRFLILRGDGTLEYRKEQGENAGLLDLRRVEITEMTNNTREEGQGEAEQGLVVRCRKMDGFETHFRCILAEAELSQFKDAVRLTAQEHNVDCLRRNSITGQGSWWLVVGSVLFVATSVVVLLNSYDDYLLLGDDDSALNRFCTA